MIVNNNLVNKKMFEKCFPMCLNIVLSDGGANQLYATECRDSKKIKGLIGDFDCVKSNILQYYKEKGVALEYVSDPETNDFDKAVEFCVRNGWYQIFCFGAFGGRMDLSLATMHLTSKYCKRYPNLDIVLLGKENIMFPIRKNLNYKIKINHKLLNPYGCGLICFGVSESVETSGFRWNLNSRTRLEWGKFISTCN
jgi:thiamine pyrophosphokinase